jgi:CheY-like chemotaxis protein
MANIPQSVASAQPTSADQALNEELGWLKKGVEEAPVPLREALHMVQQLVRPLAERREVELQLDVAVELAELPVRPLVLRSTLLTILNVAIPRAGQAPVTLAARWAQGNLAISVHAAGCDATPLTEVEVASLQTAEKLATFHQAHLELAQVDEQGFVVTLTLPRPAPLQILVIDDNPDWIELQQRYANNTRYQVIGTSDSLQAASMAAQMQPAVILLDVMIQAADGWQILSELRHEPTTAGIPVVICTILPVADLALALGADAFLQKPVSQDRYLEMLERQSG